MPERYLPTGRRDLAGAALLAVAYFLTAKLGLTFAFVNASATAVWPPTGIALAALLLVGRQLWPGIFIGAFVANVTISGIVPSLAISVGNVLEPLVAATLIARFAGNLRAFERVRYVFRFAIIAGLITPAIAATIGVASLYLAGAVFRADLGGVWLTWWLGDSVGALLFAPLVILWWLPASFRQRPIDHARLYALAIALAVGMTWWHVPAVFCFPMVLWAAFAYSRRQTATTVVLLSVGAVWGAVHGLGPFTSFSPNITLQRLQVFMGVLSATGLAVAALVVRYRRLQTDLEGLVVDRTRALQQKSEALTGESRERRRAVAALRSSEIRLLEAQSVAHVGSWEWDIATNAVWLSDELCRIFEVSPGTALDYESYLARLPEDERPRVHAVVSRALTDGLPFEFEHGIARTDGTVGTIAARGQVVREDDGRPVRILGTSQDITDRVRAEESRAALVQEQLARQQAEESSRLKDQFLATVSHELRTPLNAVAGWAEMLAAGLVEPAMMARAVQSIERNSRAQQRLIDDLLDVSAATTGRIRLDPKPIELGPIVSSAVEAVSVAAHGRGVAISVRLNAELTITGDQQRLNQIVWNLLSNAVKFTPEGGAIEIRLDREDGHAAIRVTDNGRGIEPNVLPYVFDRFWQGEPGRPRSLGLGLAIVKALVQAHGGTIEAASDGAGKGATFTVLLPLQ